MTEPTHYDVLGIAPDAGADEIRAAYRRQARQHHPDRGGEAGAMVAINRAHQVLSDDEARAQYDLGMADVDEEAAAMLAELFEQAMEVAPDRTMLGWMLAQLSALESSAVNKKAGAARKIAALQKRRDLVRVKTSGAPNMLHLIVDRGVASLKRESLQADQVLKVAAAARQMLSEYEPGEDAPARNAVAHGSAFASWASALRER